MSFEERKRITRDTIEAIYVRVVCSFTGRKPISLTQDEREILLSQWEDAIQCDIGRLEAVVQMARNETINHIHSRLHQSEGVDHEMLDETIEFAFQKKNG